MPLLPNDYKMQNTSGKYMKLADGDNIFRPLAPPIIGLILWTDENGKRKSVRRPPGSDMSDVAPSKNKFGELERVKDFAAMIVLDLDDNKIKILELTQMSIIGSVDALSRSKKWGDPWDHVRGYAININKTGQGRETEYKTLPEPKEPVSAEVLAELHALHIDLDALYCGDDPFAPSTAAPAPTPVHGGHVTAPAVEPPSAERVDTGVTVMEVKSKKNDAGQTRYGIVCDNGRCYGTFSGTRAEYAKVRLVDKLPVNIGYVADHGVCHLKSIHTTVATPAREPGDDDVPDFLNDSF